MIKPVLTIVMIVNDKERLERSIEAIRDKFKGKTHLIIGYKKDDIHIKEYIEHISISNCKVESFVIRTEFVYPRGLPNKLLNTRLRSYKVFQRKVTAYRRSWLSLQRLGYSQAFRKCKGKYLLLLSQNMLLRDNFWDECILPMQKNRNIWTVVGSVLHIGEYRLLKDTRICKSTEVYLKGYGIKEFLRGSYSGSYLAVYRNRVIKRMGKCPVINYEAHNVIFDYTTMCRMTLHASKLISDYVADYEVRKEDKVALENMTYISERYADLKGFIRHFSDKNAGDRIDVTKLREAYNASEEGFKDFVLSVGKYFEEKKEDQLAKRYQFFAETIGKG